ncbi:hypothetical protein MFLO_15905 [Listeria floridensis FSL S10-1187]|uniref:Phage protein n=1 Tax=Listeria floridensis FSL S10-1187 TaxID=1265817 RepID=A0ABN0RB76_9LIST|nr:hypothetical protein [Listeria floridensis]EUJ23449.1 hypothetical protein MFLO_15905 [Listeria floridensis FSL S10-1187]
MTNKIHVDIRLGEWLDGIPVVWKDKPMLAAYRLAQAADNYTRFGLSSSLIPKWLIKDLIKTNYTLLTTIVLALELDYEYQGQSRYYIQLGTQEHTYLNLRDDGSLWVSTNSEYGHCQTKFTKAEIEALEKRFNKPYMEFAVRVEEVDGDE